MTAKHKAQGHKQGDQQAQFAKDEWEMGRNETQQLPNTDPTSCEANNWPNQNWNAIDWGPFDYYNWGMPMVFWENLSATQEKGKQKGGETFSRADRFAHTQTRSGGRSLCQERMGFKNE